LVPTPNAPQERNSKKRSKLNAQRTPGTQLEEEKISSTLFVPQERNFKERSQTTLRRRTMPENKSDRNQHNNAKECNVVLSAAKPRRNILPGEAEKQPSVERLAARQI